MQPSSSQRQPSPLAPPLSSSSSTGGWARARRTRAPPRHATSLSACLPSPLLVWMPRETPRPPGPSHSPPGPLLSSPSPSLSCPNAPVAAVHHSRRHCLPLASPTRPRDPPRRLRPPRRATRRWMPPNTPTAVFFNPRPCRSPATVRRRQRIPEPAKLLYRPAMSSAALYP